VADLDETTLSALLLRHWDVLGVADVDVEPAAEYRHEAAEVHVLLRGGANSRDLTACLTDAAERLGASRDLGRDRRAAEAIADAYSL
jgi:hypothetical protein